MPLYFAYGSNMLPEQMARRCPGARPLGRGSLPHWKYITTKRGTANIQPGKDHVVHGALWRCDLRHIASLNRYEGVRLRNYLPRFMKISTRTGRSYTALVYVSQRILYGISRPDYMLNAVLPGAKSFDLPEYYLKELESWLPERRIGAAGRKYIGRKA